MSSDDQDNFEKGLGTGRLLAPDPFWLTGYLLGSWIGVVEKYLKGFYTAEGRRII